MKVETRSGSVERTVLMGMLTNDSVCGRIASRWEPEGLFASKWSNLIASWCTKHHAKYGKAPRESILPVFAEWSERPNRDKDTVKFVEEFLSGLSDDWARSKRRTNSDHVIDLAGTHFRLVKARKHRDHLDQLLAEGRIDDAEAAIANYGRIELGAGSFIDVLQDHEALKDAFEETKESIVKYHGALDRFLSGALEQDGFISFLAPNKSGKSWHLEDFAWRAMSQRHKVAYFQVGDMSRRRVLTRLATRAVRKPRSQEWPCTVRYPKKLTWDDENNRVSVLHEERVIKKPFKFIEARDAFERVAKRVVRSEDSYFRLWTYPNMGVSITGIREELRRAELEGFLASCVVIDYMDNLAPIDRKKENREQINETWSMARALSLERHVLVMTATQADSASFGGKRLLTRDNFTDSRKKLDHVTGMIGLNVDPDDKRDGIARWNWVNLREGDFDEHEVCWVSGCLAIANPCIRSFFRGRE